MTYLHAPDANCDCCDPPQGDDPAVEEALGNAAIALRDTDDAFELVSLLHRSKPALDQLAMGTPVDKLGYFAPDAFAELLRYVKTLDDRVQRDADRWRRTQERWGL